MKAPAFSIATAHAALLAAVCGLWLAPAPASADYGMKANQVKGEWSPYYVGKAVNKAGRTTVRTTLLDGTKQSLSLTRRKYDEAESETNVLAEGTDGQVNAFNREGKGKWTELDSKFWGYGPEGNPLVPFKTVAADLGVYAFGSRIYVPALDGWTTPDGNKHNGVLWVGDTREHLSGPGEFQIFVGGEDNLVELPEMNEKGFAVLDAEVSFTAGITPRYEANMESGAEKILSRLGYYKGGGRTVSVFNRNAAQDSKPATFEEALTEFQKAHDGIPEVEYGILNGASTRYYLAKAAHSLRKSGGRYQVPTEEADEDSESKGPSRKSVFSRS